MKKSQNKRDGILFIILLIVSLLVLLPLVHKGFYISDDGEWMVIRLSAFYQSLRDGQFPVRFLMRLNFNMGYPVSNFLYPAFLYIGSILHIIGFSFVNSIKVLLAVSIIGSVLVVYHWLKKQYSNSASFVGTLGYLLTPYIVYDLYKRGSVGEVVSLLPAILGFYALDGPIWILPGAIAFLILSHNTLALLFLFALVGYALLLGKWKAIFHILLGIAMTAFFWLPAILERHLVLFDSVTVSDPAQYFVNFLNLNLLGFVGVIMFIAALINGRKKKNRVWFFLILCGLSIFFSTSLSAPLWSIGAFASIIQFPYRFIALYAVSSSFIIAYVWSEFNNSYYKYVALGVFVLLWGLPVMYWINHVQYVVRDEGYYTTNEGTTTVANEYLPRWVHEIPSTRPTSLIDVYKGKAQVTMRSGSVQKIVADADVIDPTILQINKIYYPGWGITVDGVPVPFSYDNPRGVMAIDVPVGKHVISADFHETPKRFLIDCFSGIMFLCYVIFYLLRKKIELSRFSLR